MTRFCTSSCCWNEMRLWGIIGSHRWILHMGGIWINGSRPLRQSPMIWFLEFILLCSFLPHWIGLTKLGHKRHLGLHLALSGIICFSQLLCYKATQATLWRGPRGRDQIFPANNQHELDSHMSKSQKQILQTLSCLHFTAAPADLTTTSWETSCQDHPAKLLNSWTIETEKCWLLI